MFRENDIGFMIKQVHDGVGRLCIRKLKAHDMTRNQSDVMDWLWQRFNADTETRIGDIAQYLNVSQPTASGIVKRMREKGIVETACSKEDKRVTVIIPHIGETDTDLDDIESILLDGLNEQERAELGRLLGKIKDNVCR